MAKLNRAKREGEELFNSLMVRSSPTFIRAVVANTLEGKTLLKEYVLHRTDTRRGKLSCAGA